MLNEVNQLIMVKQYILSSINESHIDRPTVRELEKIRLLIDKKICAILLGQEFKDYINYSGAQKALEDAIIANNPFKSSIKKNV
jgi:hypothetical protein